MKIVALVIMSVVALSANAQTSIKDLLYSGKMKSDTGTVVRKGDDLSTKVDTNTRKPVEPPRSTVMPMVRDSVRGLLQTDSAQLNGVVVTTPTTPQDAGAVAAKDNNKVWKDYLDELMTALRTDVLPSKKVKSGVYSVLIEYEIGLDGDVTVNSVSCDPENSYLADQIKQRITLTAPKLTPLLNVNGKPRKAVKKQTITVTK